MITKAILAFSVAAVASTAALAATAPNFSVSGDKKFTIVQHPAGHYTPQLGFKPKAPVIYSNIASKYPKGPYFAFEGYTISGPTSPIGEQIWIAAAFTPAASATATEVDVPVGFVEGTNGVVVGIYSDNGGVPGTALWTGNEKDLENFGSCCLISKSKIKGGLALTGGTQYWVTVTTSKKESNEWAAWTLETTDQVDTATIAVNTGSGWSGSSALPGPAFAVLGK